MNPGNTELLAQKQALLTQAVSATSEKLEMLKKQQLYQLHLLPIPQKH
ncbi:MAG: hypothetical protein K2J71_06470 [Oscillospiraceae bacterium]|nr:hypothetical protein [Oscillospiraceae bacterium]